MVLKRIGVLSCGKLMGTMYAIMGLVLGGFMSLAAAFGAAARHADGGGAAVPAIFGIGAIIVIPILYGIGGFIGGLFTAAIYNVVAGMMGGLELDFEQSPAPY